MTVMFHDIHENETLCSKNHRVQGTSFDEVLYADDAICISHNAAAMNRLLKEIETEGLKYGMKLNKDKCEVVAFGKAPNIRFADGAKVNVKHEVKYLGCTLNDKCDTHKEIKHRISQCMVILKRLHLFWRHSDCSIRQKLTVYDAVIKSKLLYGLETAQLNGAATSKLDAFQLKGLRKMLKLNTTYVDRTSTNETVFRLANEALDGGSTGKQITKISEEYESRRLRLFVKVLLAEDCNPQRSVTFEEGAITQRTYGIKRVGRPKNNWIKEATQALWEKKVNANERGPGTLDLRKQRHREPLLEAAREHDS